MKCLGCSKALILGLRPVEGFLLVWNHESREQYDGMYIVIFFLPAIVLKEELDMDEVSVSAYRLGFWSRLFFSSPECSD